MSSACAESSDSRGARDGDDGTDAGESDWMMSESSLALDAGDVAAGFGAAGVADFFASGALPHADKRASPNKQTHPTAQRVQLGLD